MTLPGATLAGVFRNTTPFWQGFQEHHAILAGTSATMSGTSAIVAGKVGNEVLVRPLWQWVVGNEVLVAGQRIAHLRCVTERTLRKINLTRVRSHAILECRVREGMRETTMGDDNVDAKKLAMIQAMLADHTPGDDEDTDADILAMIAVIIKQKSRTDRAE